MDVLVPRGSVVTATTEQSLEENLQRMSDQRRLTRFPLIGASLEDTKGLLYLSEVFAHIDELRAETISLRDLAVPQLRVPHDLPVSRFIDRLQKERQEVALVERDGHIVGLVTVTEALEAIAGELENPFDQ